MYRLVILTGARKGHRLVVQKGNLLIGRAPDVQLDLRDDDTVSHHHAVIEDGADGYYLRELGGMNPPEVNGQPVRGVLKLKADDQIEIGRTLMQFQVPTAPTATARRSTGFLYLFTFGLLGLLLAGQAAFWFVFPWLCSRPPAAPAVAPAPAVDPLQAELEAALAEAVAPPAAPDLAGGGTPGAPAGAPDEFQNLRAAVADLRKQLDALSNQTATSSGPTTGAPPDQIATAQVEAVTGPPSNTVATTESRLAAAKAQLNQAVSAAQRSQVLEADAILEMLQADHPDFLPAYVERARLFEQRGQLKEAGAQWEAVLARNPAGALYEQAAGERQRLARAEIDRAMPRAGARPVGPLPRRIRVVAIERERFAAGRDYDEMRQARVTLQPAEGEAAVEADQVTVVVTFYDRNEAADTVHPTRAEVPRQPLRIEGLWQDREPRVVTATYLVPPGFRVQEAAQHSGRSRYEGVRVQVYYQGRLQDDDALPRDLLRQPAPPAPGPARAAAGGTA